MPRTSKDETRRRLRDAVVDEAVEQGFAGASVAGVVRRARVSAGTVYVHFANKDDMLRAVYMEIKREFHALMTAARDEPTTLDMIRRMWFGLFDFVSANPREFLFLEYGAAAKMLTPEQQAEAARMGDEIAAMLRRGIEDGTLAPLDRKVLTLLLVAPAMQLAREAVQTGSPVPADVVETVFGRVWRSIAAN